MGQKQNGQKLAIYQYLLYRERIFSNVKTPVKKTIEKEELLHYIYKCA